MIVRVLQRLALFACVAVPLSAQSARSDAVMMEKAAAPFPNNPTPKYPQVLVADTSLKTLPAGRVVVELTVRPDGSVDPASITVVSVSDSAFIAPVLEVLPRWRFLPAEIGPAPNGPFTTVEQRVRLPVTIAAPRRRRRE
jgi:TonB family protein